MADIMGVNRNYLQTRFLLINLAPYQKQFYI